MLKLAFFLESNPLWRRVMGLLSISIFISLSDAILSDWVPGFLQSTVGSSFVMGLIMSFSSVVGLVADLIFPQLFSGVMVRQLMKLAMGASVLFVSSLFFATLQPLIPILLLAMAVWGVYYEFLGFAQHQFVAEEAGVEDRSKVWAVMGTFRSFAYFLGPILGGVLMSWGGDRGVVLSAGILTLISFLMLALIRLSKKRVETEMGGVNILTEVHHWWVLLEHLWPVIVMSLLIGVIDATFWTTGVVFNDILAKNHPWGGLFLPMYMLPSLFIGFLVMKWGIYRRKKVWSEIFLCFAGLFLVGLSLNSSIWWMLLMVFLSSSMLAVVYPLVEAVYSDILARMGKERKHLMGLSNSTFSLAYIVGPTLAGYLSSVMGEKMTFVSLGMGVVVVAVALLLVTPKKLKLPQTEIQSW